MCGLMFQRFTATFMRSLHLCTCFTSQWYSQFVYSTYLAYAPPQSSFPGQKQLMKEYDMQIIRFPLGVLHFSPQACMSFILHGPGFFIVIAPYQFMGPDLWFLTTAALLYCPPVQLPRILAPHTPSAPTKPRVLLIHVR